MSDVHIREIEKLQETIKSISHRIWDFAELSLQEVKSAALYEEALEKAGFTVQKGYSGIETAFSGAFSSGTGKPVIGILGEFDALSGLSQKAACTEREEVVKNGPGHGCGHNMLGAAAFGAALGVKKYLEETGTNGTVIFFGCPGEEGGSSKAFMAREGIWKSLDAALSWHPGRSNQVTTGTNNSCVQALYEFRGTAAHAAANPEQGRSALDAVELMNVGVNYLREHMKPDCRVHYSMIDGGGVSPNVVQPHASVLYMIRSCKVTDTLDLEKRVDDCAKGASIMTGTTFTKIFVDGTANTLPNTTIEKVLYESMKKIPLPVYTDEERTFAEKLDATCPAGGDLPGHGAKYDASIREEVRILSEGGKKTLNDFLMPFYTGNEFSPGSTDVGDVSRQTPTGQFTAVTFTAHSPGHSWQNVSAGASSIGDKGTIYAAEVLSDAAVTLLRSPDTLEQAKKELAMRLEDDPYVCPIPADAVPYVIP
ncbi:MAG: amidohydrolase [Lachnospiraceae bacterium]|nr:amidohydrolase [Lachnospiraceae bacterium]